MQEINNRQRRFFNDYSTICQELNKWAMISYLLALASVYNKLLSSTEYTERTLFSSTMANLLREADKSKQRTLALCLTRDTGNGLSANKGRQVKDEREKRNI